MNWISIIGFAAMGQCFLMASLYALGRRSVQQRLLILLFIAMGCYQLHEVLVQSQLIIIYPFFVGWGSLFPLLIAPLLFMYVQSIVRPDYRFAKISLLHLLPLALALISQWEVVLESSQKKTERLQSVFETHAYPETEAFQSFGWEELTHFAVWHLQPIVYFILVVVVVVKARNRIYSAHKLARWLKFLAFGFLFYFISNYLTELYLPGVLGKRRLMIEIPLFSFYIYALCLLVLKMSPRHIVNAISKDAMEKDEMDAVFQRLEQLMEDKQYYLQPQVQLADVAAALGLPGRDVSLVIKKSSGLSYSDFINNYRVEHSQELMKQDKYRTYTIQAIGEASGFKSKDAFYRAFQKVNALTPKAYQDEVNRPNS